MTNLLEAVLTAQTCGEACWRAREDICRCSCGGANHACLRSENSEQPVRTSRILDHVYQLVAVGRYAEGEMIVRGIEDACRKAGITWHWHPKNRGAPAIRKGASQSQVERWPELTAYRSDAPLAPRASLVWLRLDLLETLDPEAIAQEAHAKQERWDRERAERLARYS